MRDSDGLTRRAGRPFERPPGFVRPGRERTTVVRACVYAVCLLLASATLDPGPPPPVDDMAQVRAQVARSSTYYGDIDFPAGAEWIAFATENGVPKLVVASTRGDPHPKTMDAGEFWSRPSVSPDGRFIVAESTPATEVSGAPPLSLRIYDTQSTKGEELVAALPEQDLRDVMWSTDSRRILYRCGWKGVSTLHVIDIASRRDEVIATFQSPIRAPRWLPNGSGILFFQGPDLWLIDSDGKGLRRLTNFPTGSEAAPGNGSPHSPAFAPDHDAVAISVSTPGECYRIRLVDLDGGEVRTPFADECAISPKWFPGGNELAFLRLGDATRTLWSRPLGGGDARSLGFGDGMTYSHGFASDGSLLFNGGPSDYPRSIWRVLPDRLPPHEPRLVVSMFDPPLERRWISKPVQVSIPSSNGLQIPVVVFPRTCGDPSRPGLAVVWVHHDNDFVSAQWVREIQFLALSGITVLAVNYRGNAGYGPHLRSFKNDARGKVDDVVAAIDYARERPDVDKQRLFLLHVSSASPVGYGAIVRARGKLRGVIDWVGVPWREVLTSPSDALPPMLWLSGIADPMTPERRDIARQLSFRVPLTYAEFPGGHSARGADAYVPILDTIERFVDKTAGVPRCTRGVSDASPSR